MSMTAAKISSFDTYLRTHNAVKGEGFTHTRIGDKTLGIFGGSYKINDSEWKKFMELYYQEVFVKGNNEYLTEKQLIENGPVMIDIDLRYDVAITEKQHSKDHLIDAVMLYMEKIKQLLDISEGATIPVYVMEKSAVNTLENKTKDGIHIIIGVQMHKALQVLLRKKVLQELNNIWSDLPITNAWEDVLDEGVTKGFVNWQVYGSRKPAHQAYMIKYYFELTYNRQEWEIEECPLAKFSTEKNIYKLSARYTEHPGFPLKEGVHSEFEAAKLTLHQNNSSAAKKTDAPKYKLKIKQTATNLAGTYADIANEAMLDNMLEALFEDIGPLNYRIKETHDYTLSLPASYYGPGSYNKWIRVGMALYNTNPDLFLTWLKFSCQENCRDTLTSGNGKFDWRQVPELYETWGKFSHNNPDCLTYRSIMYWSKNDARDKYDAIRKDTIDFFITQSIQTATATEFDLASVLYNMYKDRFVCTSIKNKTWYEYVNHRWHEIDSGNTLRLAISKEMHQIYFEKTCETTNQAHSLGEPGDPGRDKMMKTSQKINDICILLKKTQSKQNIMREACELFYDKEFLSKLDKNPYLLCFNNGVVDFKQRIHRKGQPDDFISKCTNNDYMAYNPTKHAPIMRELNDFMAQLFPVKELEEYMWSHLSSCLIGVNTNQTFHVYKGSGRNGKSVLTSLMGKSMGSYKGTVPITLITTKRNSVGSTSSEVAQLDGIRYAVMQEPTKGDKINEGAMKELTGGTDPIQARALFKDAITFVPMFKLVVCTNTDFEDTSNDDGTWRRMRYIDFMAKFLENPYEDEIKFPRSECPYQFPLDRKLEDKFEAWVPVFMARLVQLAYENLGLVKDCDSVMANSDKHRENQDYMAGFLKEHIRAKEGSSVKKVDMMETFKEWYIQNYGKALPKGKEITEFMNHRYGVYNPKQGGWRNIEIIRDDEGGDPLDDC
jgi:P4 family phage/plasmid primase-like protien